MIASPSFKNPVIERNMTRWSAADGDRVDPVAQALRRLHLRVELCPCQFRGATRCRQCVLDVESIEEAWTASEPKE